MRICSGVRSSRPVGTFSFGLLDGLSVRLRRPRVREAPAGVGLERLATAGMNNRGSCPFDRFIQRRAAFPDVPRCALPRCRPIWEESRLSSIARPSRAQGPEGVCADRFRSVRRSRSSRSPVVRCYHEQPGIIRNHIQERAVHFFGSPASQTVRFVLWRVGGQ